MRPRFSLRSLLGATTLLALFLYYWVIRPTQNAKQFVNAVNSEDYKTADELTWHATDLAFEKWRDERWGFSPKAELTPWTTRQLLQGAREINLYMNYFQLEETHEVRMHLTATSRGIKNPVTVAAKSRPVIDSNERTGRVIPKR